MAGKKTAKQKRDANIIDVFNTEYGMSDTKLGSWQKLCEDVGVTVGSSLTQCKKALKTAHINIVDFVAAKQAGAVIPRHASANKLREYTKNTGGKVFPLKKAKASPFLKAFLIQMYL
ncbi:unnamed protein product [Zymoseptoria tritici ST99CH_3D7]|uniref:Uncharacterized protein n=1 Tax=Zymoseptoria tritici (strain ST99CH_3D7) TaxID=1276538 RepID=A0A1X7REW2_ZYMT9|nr:unnamed protein product [Zymoseptoria tritici ST99CH_3D7]